MTPSPKQAMLDSMIDRSRSARRVVVVAAWLTAVLAGAGCKKEFPDEPTRPDAAVAVDGGAIDGAVVIDAPAACDPERTAPTYTELYNKYFAVGKPGHCATEGCHGDPGHNVWLCGTNKDMCYAGMLGGQWSLERFEPMPAIPSTVKLTVYTTHIVTAANSTAALQRLIQDVEAGRLPLNLDRVFRFDEIAQAHRYMEDNRATGKLVVTVD